LLPYTFAILILLFSLHIPSLFFIKSISINVVLKVGKIYQKFVSKRGSRKRSQESKIREEMRKKKEKYLRNSNRMQQNTHNGKGSDGSTQ
jgi:hypothetical protein